MRIRKSKEAVWIWIYNSYTASGRRPSLAIQPWIFHAEPCFSMFFSTCELFSYLRYNLHQLCNHSCTHWQFCSIAPRLLLFHVVKNHVLNRFVKLKNPAHMSYFQKFPQNCIFWYNILLFQYLCVCNLYEEQKSTALSIIFHQYIPRRKSLAKTGPRCRNRFGFNLMIMQIFLCYHTRPICSTTLSCSCRWALIASN